MSNLLRPPSLGPIVGHTTEKSLRVWMRGADAEDQRTVGVAALYQNNKYVAGSAQYIRLQREYDRTGCSDFPRDAKSTYSLTADTLYQVKMGSLTIDTVDPFAPSKNEDIFGMLPPAERWLEQLSMLDESAASAEARTFPSGQADKLSFIFGSCRYPGVLWMKKQADIIFRAVRDKFGKRDVLDPRFFLMVGDQIYADILPKDAGISVADTFEEFQDRYHTAFGAPNTRELLRTVPTYMILDDHEIEDNWVHGRLADSKKASLFNFAINAYRSYQWSHCPQNFGDNLFYKFGVAGHPFFVLDQRTKRIREDEDMVLDDNHLLGFPAKDPKSPYKGQLDLLCEWLISQQTEIGNRPKFVVSPSVFAPNDVSTVKPGNPKRDLRGKAASDSWPAFPETRRTLLKTIIGDNPKKLPIQNVVFLSGDVHCSSVAHITFDDDKAKTPLTALDGKPLLAFSITSSAFFWPYPFADGDPNEFVHDSTKEGDNFDIYGDGDKMAVMKYVASEFVQNDNFVQVDVNLAGAQPKIVARMFDQDGGELRAVTLKLST